MILSVETFLRHRGIFNEWNAPGHPAAGLAVVDLLGRENRKKWSG